MSNENNKLGYTSRLTFVKGVLLLGVAALVLRMAYLNLNQREFLQGQGDARYLRTVAIPAHRGMITDRNGEPLAISTPVESVWANPQELANARSRWPQLAKSLGIDAHELTRQISLRKDKEFIYLRRHVNPELAEQVMALGIPGVSLQPEYRRYYPMGEVVAHVVGFTNIDDIGQEGVELMMDKRLRGVPGSKRVLKDRLGRIVENVESISEPRAGDDLQLSIDRRIQYLAYRELKAAVQRHHARGGSAVMLDVTTGEVLAMVNQPSYNPNNRSDLSSSRLRNRAVTDVFEPGSTMKPFTIVAALESGRYTPTTPINTEPGMMRLGRFTIRDTHDHGLIDVSTVIQKSSNVGASLIALSMQPKRLWDVLSRFGFGYDTGSGFPGETAGLLSAYQDWREVDRATISYGYGLSVTPLQLANAYATLASNGEQRPVSFFKVTTNNHSRARQVVTPHIAEQVRAMLERVVQPGGTGTRAKVEGYRVAGKTGTVRKAAGGGYTEDRYFSVFAGMAPASHPRLVMVVMVDSPDDGEYYGGLIAAPVFSRVMEGALRLMDIAPDDLTTLKGVRMAMTGAQQ